MNNDLEEKDRIHYQWMLNRIQQFKYLVLTIIVAMMAYTANSIDVANTYISIILLSISATLLFIAFIIAGRDAGGAILYNEKSQEGVSKMARNFMYCLILLSSILIFSSKINNSVKKIDSQITSKNIK